MIGFPLSQKAIILHLVTTFQKQSNKKLKILFSSGSFTSRQLLSQMAKASMDLNDNEYLEKQQSGFQEDKHIINKYNYLTSQNHLTSFQQQSNKK